MKLTIQPIEHINFLYETFFLPNDHFLIRLMVSVNNKASMFSQWSLLKHSLYKELNYQCCHSFVQQIHYSSLFNIIQTFIHPRANTNMLFHLLTYFYSSSSLTSLHLIIITSIKFHIYA